MRISSTKELWSSNRWHIRHSSWLPSFCAYHGGTIVNIGEMYVRFFHNHWMLKLPPRRQLNSMECLILRFQGCCSQLQRRFIHGTPSRWTSRCQIKYILQCHQSFRACTNTLYSNFLPVIIRRIYPSQGPNSMPTKDFAQQVVFNALRKNPPRYMSIGRGSWLFAWLKWLPRGLVLAYMWRLYSS